MSFGNFNETSESKEVSEAPENRRPMRVRTPPKTMMTLTENGSERAW